MVPEACAPVSYTHLGHHIGSPMGAKDDPNGDKFGQLLRFAQEDFAKKTPFVWLAIEDKVYTFEVFGVYYTEAYMIPVQYHHPSFSKDDWDMLIEDVQARSLYTYEAVSYTHLRKKASLCLLIF